MKHARLGGAQLADKESSKRYWVKASGEFTVLDRSLEAPLHEQKDYLTPTDKFFVCNNGTTPIIDQQSYRLRIEGDAVGRTLDLTYDELKSMPQRTVPAVIECAGNHRQLFELSLNERLDKRPHVTEVRWTLGGVGMAEWRGVPLRDVLERAGVKTDAHHVCPSGLEQDAIEGTVQCPMPIAKALDEDTILALEMNGRPLPPDHGFPVRVLVPGWVGTYSIKWVGRILVTRQHIWTHRNTEFYVLMGREWPAEKFSPAKGAPITKQSLKSSLALPWPANLSAGKHTLHGYARSPDARIARVEWSDDLGQTWSRASLTSPNFKYGWARFEFNWEAKPGEQSLMTRTFDETGQTQPTRIPFNDGGYLFNMVHHHPVIVQ